MYHIVVSAFLFTAFLAGPKVLAQKSHMSDPHMPSNMSQLPYVSGIHLNAGQKIDTTIFFKNPDNGLPGSYSFKGEVVTNPDSTWSLMVSSVSGTQDYYWYSNSPGINSKNVISLFCSKAVPHALQLRMETFDASKQMLTLQGVDDKSTIWRAVMGNGFVDSVWRNDETRMHDFKNWKSEISQVGNGTGYYSFTLSLSRDFAAAPYEVKLLDSTAVGRLPFLFDNVSLTAPTLEADCKQELFYRPSWTLNIAEPKTSFPDIKYNYKDTTVNDVIVGRTTFYIANTSRYDSLLTTSDRDYNSPNDLGYSVTPLNFVFGLVPPKIADSSFLNYHYGPDFIAYQAAPGRVGATSITDTAYHWASATVGANGIFGYNWGFSDRWAVFPRDSANELAAAPTFTMIIRSQRIINADSGRLEPADSVYVYNFKFRRNSLTGHYELDAGHDWIYDSKTKQWDSISQDPGKFLAMREHLHVNLWRDSVVATITDTTDSYMGVVRRVHVKGLDSVEVIYNEQPKLQMAIEPYATSQPFHNIYLLLPAMNATQVDPKSLSFIWNAGKSGFKYHLQVATDEEFKNPVMDTLVADTSVVMNSLPKMTRGFWKVKAVNTEGDGPQSVTNTFTVQITDTTHSGVVFSIPFNNDIEIFPNPFSKTTTLAFDLLKSSPVEISIYNVMGEHILDIRESEYASGHHEMPIDLGGLAGGTYFIRVSACGMTETTAVTIVR